MTRIIGIALGTLVMASVALAAAPATGERIQLAVLLDTSSSMDGLIDQARHAVKGGQMIQIAAGVEGQQRRLGCGIDPVPEQYLPVSRDLQELHGRV